MCVLTFIMVFICTFLLLSKTFFFPSTNFYMSLSCKILFNILNMSLIKQIHGNYRPLPLPRQNFYKVQLNEFLSSARCHFSVGLDKMTKTPYSDGRMSQSIKMISVLSECSSLMRSIFAAELIHKIYRIVRCSC